MKHVTILDANAILRYILDDVPEQADKVEEVLRAESIVILPEVVAEVVYILNKLHGISREKTSEYILVFLGEVECRDANILKSLDYFGKHALDFVDCLLLSYAANYKIFTFDKKLLKALEKTGKRSEHEA